MRLIKMKVTELERTCLFMNAFRGWGIYMFVGIKGNDEYKNQN